MYAAHRRGGDSWVGTDAVAERNPALILLTSNETADLLRISRRTLERMRVEGGGPRYLKVGGGKRSRVLYREGEILAWLEQNSFGSTSEYPGPG